MTFNANSIDENLVRILIRDQFPQWNDLVVRAVKCQGWDNRTFHLGKEFLVRLPSSPDYASQVEKEQKWLPILSTQLPLSIPTPIAMGKPQHKYPWNWSIYQYLPGEAASNASIKDENQFAKKLAEFLIALQKIDSTNGPEAGPHSFYRGGLLSTYDSETRKSAEILKDKLDTKIILKIWEEALSSRWQFSPVWVHGDISLGNLLVDNGELSAVIDFGQLAVGDPACDLAIAWTFFKDENREIFRKQFSLDEETWKRGRGWALWKALVTAAGLQNSNNAEGKECWRIIQEIISLNND